MSREKGRRDGLARNKVLIENVPRIADGKEKKENRIYCVQIERGYSGGK